jgi:hypothetical protein
METQMTRSFRLWVKFQILTPSTTSFRSVSKSKGTQLQLLTDGAQIKLALDLTESITESIFSGIQESCVSLY